MTGQPLARQTDRQRAILFGLLLATFALRLHGLLQLPGFVDEGNHLLWASEIWQGRVIFPVSTAKPLEIYYLAALMPFRQPLWVGRFGSVLATMVTLAGLWALARQLGDGRAGLWAAALYATMPWTFFHERLAIADPLVAATAVGLTWAAAVWSRRPSAPRTAAVTLGLLALPLAKLSAAPLALMPLVVTFLCRKRLLRRLWLPYGAAALGVALALLLASLRYSVADEVLMRSGYGGGGLVRWIAGNTRDAVEWAGLYLGVQSLLIALGAAVALWRRTPLALAALAGCLIGGGPFIVAPSTSFPRYFLPALAFGSLLAAGLVRGVLDLTNNRPVRWLIPAAVAAAVGWPFAAFAAQAYRDPAGLRLAPVDRIQHITNWSSGYGTQEAVAFAAAQIAGDEQPAVVYAGELSTRVIAWLYWPAEANGALHLLWDSNAPDLTATVSSGRPTYLILDTTRGTASFAGLAIEARELARFDRPAGGAPVVAYRLVPSRP